MVRFIFILIVGCFPLINNAQSYVGFGADNFNGVHGVLTNPANIADSRSKIDINLISASLFTTNNYVELSYWKLLNDPDAQYSRLSKIRDTKNDAFGYLNSDILGPSALITLSEKHAIALTTRGRSLLNINNIDNQVVNYLEEGIDNGQQIFVSDLNSTAVTNNFIEYGISYARVLKNNKIHFFKAGATLKYLTGHGFASVAIEDGLLLDSQNAATPSPDVILSGSATGVFSDNFNSNKNDTFFDSDDEYLFNTAARGYGIDIGFVYEYRPNHRDRFSRDQVKDQVVIRHKNTYKYKIGVSILDVGAIKYTSTEIGYLLNNVNRETLNTGNQEEIESSFPRTIQRIKNYTFLPTRLRADFDLKLKDKFYLNTAGHLSLISRKSDAANRYASQIMISPRYETKWLTVYSPLSVTSHAGFQWGAGARLGPIFIGSSGLFTRWFDSETRAFDVYAGVKIPIFHKTPKPPKEASGPSQLDSNCEGCGQNGVKLPKKRLEGYQGGIKGFY